MLADMAEAHNTHDGHIYADDSQCICVSDATNIRCPRPADGSDGMCRQCRAARA